MDNFYKFYQTFCDRQVKNHYDDDSPAYFKTIFLFLFTKRQNFGRIHKQLNRLLK